MKIRNLICAAALTLTLGATSCFGPNKAFTGLTDWNMEVAEEDWVKEILFIGLWIVPAYQVALLVDIVVLNTVDYWSENG